MTDDTRWHPFDASGRPGWYRRIGDRVDIFMSTDGRDPNEMSEHEVAQVVSSMPVSYRVE
jgi:hypothetical protein